MDADAVVHHHFLARRRSKSHQVWCSWLTLASYALLISVGGEQGGKGERFPSAAAFRKFQEEIAPVPGSSPGT